ncbi:MAG TPA: SMC family ATPase [Actinophytocola sp.]|uniref:SMC family ATPase n=1 Tax=Actinophytocola sp. TaxID=1872138 RepID=UPI002DBE9248|nr:SMC family ATPase [Actinophytocola sp.]HEU5470782.1 SMC family ATPase [Actinophytocola sp.]
MRPLRLMLDGFGSYRERTEIDLSDVEFFVLTGPTGSGKSTVIDALCFALYGTVPRWGKGNVIRNALAPSTVECRVCLVFEVAGARYAAARALKRDARGQVHTKEARLDRLDPAVPADGDLAKILEACVEPIVEGPDQVTARVSALLGISYEHFTQCVLLPQGRFAEFLHAKPSERQDLLSRLLAYGIYEEIGRRARERAQLAGDRLAMAERRLAELGTVTEADIAAGERRVTELAGLVSEVDSVVAEIADLRDRWKDANVAAESARTALAELAALRVPGDVADLSARLAVADELIDRRVAEAVAAERAEERAQAELAGLADLAVLHGWREAHRREAAVRDRLDRLCAERDAAEGAESAAAEELATAERALTEAETAQAATDRAHRAVALATDLAPGAPCPVCLRTVDSVPHHEVPADLDAARAAVKAAKAAVTDGRRRHTAASRTAEAARTEVGSAQRQAAELAGELRDAPPAAEVITALEHRQTAEAAMDRARTAAAGARKAVDQARTDREALREEERRAWSALRDRRDTFVALGVPALDGSDPAGAWRDLLAWAGEARAELSGGVAELESAERELRARGSAAATGLIGLLERNGVDVTDAAAAPVALARHRERAARDLAQARERAERAAGLAAEVDRHRAEHQVAELLGQLLRSDGFERWLCAEALESLVLEASQTLMQLSGGQYELLRGTRNELVVVDHNDAGTQRPVNTLSGGETFQASLALALALSHQVAGLSGGRRDLNSMFLDEGFGTLDESTLDIVASTLERLAAETDRMVGIVTHVPALAERVPVRFAVTRDGASSRLTRLGM